MTRRISLAVALAFTTVVTFAVIAVGGQAGFFSGGKPSKAAATVEQQPETVTAPAAPVPAQEAPAPASAEPVVITSYVYIQDTPVAGAPAAAQPVATNPAQATSTAAAVATQPTAPAATRTAVPSPTTAPAPTATAAQPTIAAPPALPAEIEFVGTVTAISGDQVTFLHGSTKTTIKVTNPGALSVGASAHVHAVLTSSGYVATEVQAGG